MGNIAVLTSILKFDKQNDGLNNVVEIQNNLVKTTNDLVAKISIYKRRSQEMLKINIIQFIKSEAGKMKCYMTVR